MYYKIGDVCQKVINVDGFDFKLAVKKQDYSILVNVLDLEDRFIDSINITDEKRSIHSIRHIKSIYLWMDWREHRRKRQAN